MIQRLVGFCLVVGLTAAGPLRKGGYAPAPPGARPPCAEKGLTFCEEVDKYPTKLIQTLLQSKSFDMYGFFTDESEGLDEPPEYLLHQEMTADAVAAEDGKNKRKTRGTNTASESEDTLSMLCPIQNKTATPRLASNSKGEWRFIAQDEMLKVEQKFPVVLCNDSIECQKSCTQFYTPVPMLSVNLSGEDATRDIFWMPSSCRCFANSNNIV